MNCDTIGAVGEVFGAVADVISVVYLAVQVRKQTEEFAYWRDNHEMDHIRGAPYHPMTQGKIEHGHQTLKNRILMELYYLPGDLMAQIDTFVEYYNHWRYHERLRNLTPAYVYFGCGQSVLNQR